MGGAMDLVSSGTKVLVLTEHCSKDGKSKILKKCKLPLTGTQCVSKIISEFAVFEVWKEMPLLLTDIYKDMSIENLRYITDAEFEVS